MKKQFQINSTWTQAVKYSRGPFMAAMFLLVFWILFGAMMNQACRPTLKSLAAECLVGVRLGLLNS